MNRTCTVCGKEKTLDQFGHRKYRENYICKKCHARYMRRYRAIQKTKGKGQRILQEFLDKKRKESEEE